MYLKSLTLRGFKSFASATTLQLEPGITCIVGPNGSGKSNVVDALAWVMGEQGAKSLRGGKMEDVIFAGTSGRPPLGRAEVVLTIDNADGALPIEYAEVTISRTMFRNGGSEYAINGQSCRLLDVQELLSRLRHRPRDARHRRPGPARLDPARDAGGPARLHRGGRRRPQAPQAQGEGAAQAGVDRGQPQPARRPAQRDPPPAQAAGPSGRGRPQGRGGPGRRPRRPGPAAGRRGRHRAHHARAGAGRRDRAAGAAGRGRGGAGRRAAAEAELEAALREGLPQLAAAQETWFGLSGLGERLRGTVALAGERVRNAGVRARGARGPRPRGARDRGRAPCATQEAEIAAEVERRRAALAATRWPPARRPSAATPRRSAGWPRWSAPPPTGARGWPGCQGQVNAKRSRAGAAEEEIGRLRAARQEAAERAERAQRDFTSLETRIAGLADGEEGLDAEHEAAAMVLGDLEDRLGKLREEAQGAERERSALTARKEALEMGLARKDAAAALLGATEPTPGLVGSVAALLQRAPRLRGSGRRHPRPGRRRGRRRRARGRARRGRRAQGGRPGARLAAAHRPRSGRERIDVRRSGGPAARRHRRGRRRGLPRLRARLAAPAAGRRRRRRRPRPGRAAWSPPGPS